VTDVNDNRPVFATPEYWASVARVLATDEDESDNLNLTSFVPGGPIDRARDHT